MRHALISLVLLGACAPNGDEGILVTKNVVPGAGCSFVGDISEGFFPDGQWSSTASTGYLFHPQMQSRITALPGEENERTIVIQAANVDLTVDSSLGLNLDDGLLHFKAPFSVPLPPIVGGTLTSADGEFQLIPPEIVDAVVAANPTAGQPAGPGNPTFSTLIQASFVVVGKMSGNDVTSQPFVYGVTLSNNVVVQEAGPCPVTTGTVAPGNPCNPFQDGLVTCCTTGNALVCPAPMM